jgi:hypothetical protein
MPVEPLRSPGSIWVASPHPSLSLFPGLDDPCRRRAIPGGSPTRVLDRAVPARIGLLALNCHERNVSLSKACPAHFRAGGAEPMISGEPRLAAEHDRRRCHRAQPAGRIPHPGVGRTTVEKAPGRLDSAQVGVPAARPSWIEAVRELADLFAIQERDTVRPDDTARQDGKHDGWCDHRVAQRGQHDDLCQRAQQHCPTV